MTEYRRARYARNGFETKRSCMTEREGSERGKPERKNRLNWVCKEGRRQTVCLVIGYLCFTRPRTAVGAVRQIAAQSFCQVCCKCWSVKICERLLNVFWFGKEYPHLTNFLVETGSVPSSASTIMMQNGIFDYYCLHYEVENALFQIQWMWGNPRELSPAMWLSWQ